MVSRLAVLFALMTPLAAPAAEDKATPESKARAALLKAKVTAALSAAAQKARAVAVATAPAPRPKSPCECCANSEPCECKDDCRCQSAGECVPQKMPAKKADVPPAPELVVVGYQYRQVCENGTCRLVAVPVYGYR